MISKLKSCDKRKMLILSLFFLIVIFSVVVVGSINVNGDTTNLKLYFKGYNRFGNMSNADVFYSTNINIYEISEAAYEYEWSATVAQGYQANQVLTINTDSLKNYINDANGVDLPTENFKLDHYYMITGINYTQPGYGGRYYSFDDNNGEYKKDFSNNYLMFKYTGDNELTLNYYYESFGGVDIRSDLSQEIYSDDIIDGLEYVIKTKDGKYLEFSYSDGYYKYVGETDTEHVLKNNFRNTMLIGIPAGDYVLSHPTGYDYELKLSKDVEFSVTGENAYKSINVAFDRKVRFITNFLIDDSIQYYTDLNIVEGLSYSVKNTNGQYIKFTNNNGILNYDGVSNSKVILTDLHGDTDVVGLPAGTYILAQEGEVKNYSLAEAVEFTVTDSDINKEVKLTISKNNTELVIHNWCTSGECEKESKLMITIIQGANPVSYFYDKGIEDGVHIYEYAGMEKIDGTTNVISVDGTTKIYKLPIDMIYHYQFANTFGNDPHLIYNSYCFSYSYGRLTWNLVTLDNRYMRTFKKVGTDGNATDASFSLSYDNLGYKYIFEHHDTLLYNGVTYKNVYEVIGLKEDINYNGEDSIIKTENGEFNLLFPEFILDSTKCYNWSIKPTEFYSNYCYEERTFISSLYEIDAENGYLKNEGKLMDVNASRASYTFNYIKQDVEEGFEIAGRVNFDPSVDIIYETKTDVSDVTITNNMKPKVTKNIDGTNNGETFYFDVYEKSDDSLILVHSFELKGGESKYLEPKYINGEEVEGGYLEEDKTYIVKERGNESFSLISVTGTNGNVIETDTEKYFEFVYKLVDPVDISFLNRVTEINGASDNIEAPIENPDTGTFISILVLSVFVLSLTIAFVISKKYDKFRKI